MLIYHEEAKVGVVLGRRRKAKKQQMKEGEHIPFFATRINPSTFIRTSSTSYPFTFSSGPFVHCTTFTWPFTHCVPVVGAVTTK
jgi:hypothetical protein